MMQPAIPMTITLPLRDYLEMGRTIDMLREQVERLEKQPGESDASIGESA